MRRLSSQEIKRKIDSKIFELQSALLEDDVVTEGLLRECTVWFRPSHLQDIVVERSEAEQRCGWPGCGNSLSSYRFAAPLVFDVPDGELFRRFCTKSCLAKTQALLHAIPPTPPYSRPEVVHLACPSAFGSAPVGEGGKPQVPDTAYKKVYKRPRRRDLPPPPAETPKLASSAAGDDRSAASAGISGVEKRTNDDAVGRQVSAEPNGTAETLGRDREGGSGVRSGSGRASTGEGNTVGNRSNGHNTMPAAEEGDGDVSAAQARLERLSLSERSRLPSSAAAHPLAGTSSDPAMGDTSASSPVANTRQETPSQLSGTVSTGDADSVTAGAISSGAPSTGAAPSPAPQAMRTNQATGPALGRRKSVTFADGTKDDPPAAAADSMTTGLAAASSSGGGNRVGLRATGRSGGVTRRRGGASRGRERGTPSARPKAAAAAPKPTVLGGVIERKATGPAPMEAKDMGYFASGDKAGLVEGYLPKIEADLSFHVLPRGYGASSEESDSLASLAGSISGVEEKKCGFERREDAEEAFVTSETAGEDEEEVEEAKATAAAAAAAAGVEGTEDWAGDAGSDDDENDRTIWRETFGEDMPAEVAEGSWIDMDAVHNKEMREEFASSIASFAILWGALSEWVTPETRAVCRAGRAAASAAAMEAQGSGTAPAAAATESDGASKSDTANNAPRISASDALRRRKACAVAAAAEEESRRIASRRRGYAELGKHDSQRKRQEDLAAGLGGIGGASGELTVTGTLRQGAVSTMVNMYLAQAERALNMTAIVAAGRSRDTPRPERSRPGPSTWIWSETAARGEAERPGSRRGAWIEQLAGESLRGPTEAEAARRAPAAETPPPQTAPLSKGHGPHGEDHKSTPPDADVAAAAAAPADEHRTESSLTRVADLGGESGGAAAATRRALAALIETMDAARASAAANLSTAQWKAVPLVLLTAIGLGAPGSGEGSKADAARGAEACAHLCGRESMLSAREFEMLVEALIED